MKDAALDVASVYRRLKAAYGAQAWWPAETEFEVMVGAVLTQNTAWTNVERAIGQLRGASCLTPGAIVALPSAELAQLIRPSGYFNVKAERLKNLCRWYVERGEHAALEKLCTEDLRQELLALKGIGPETADDILLYAFHRPVFVIDAYTRRLFGRLGLIAGDEHYEELRRFFEEALSREAEPVPLFNEYHALIVEHAKGLCRKRPECEACFLSSRCSAEGK